MKKQDLIKIARTIYLQNIVSKQLFAATYNHLKDNLNKQLGSLRTTQKLSTCYQAFVGSQQRAGSQKLQFIKKQGMNFIIYKLNLTMSSVSSQVLTTLPLQRISWFLTTLQSFISTQAAGESIQKVLQALSKTSSKMVDQIKLGKNGRNKTIDDQQIIDGYIQLLQQQFQKFNGLANKLGKMISTEDSVFSSSLNEIQNSISELNSHNQNNELSLQNPQLLNGKLQVINNACKTILQLLKNSNAKYALKSISTNASRINMLSKIYNQAVDIVQNVQDESVAFFARQIQTAIQTCNDTKDLMDFDADLATKNLQDYWEIVDRSYIKQDQFGNKVIDNKQQYQMQNGVRYAKNSFVSFLGGYLKRISTTIFDQALTSFMQTYNIDQNLYEKFEQLDSTAQWIKEKIINDKKDEFDLKSNNDVFFYSDFVQTQPQLMEQLKQLSEYL